MTTEAERLRNLRAAIREIRAVNPTLPANPTAWTTPDSPYALMTRHIAESADRQVAELRAEVRRWALGMAAAVFVALLIALAAP